MFFHKYPYTSLTELNLDWLIEKVGKLERQIEEPVRDEKRHLCVIVGDSYGVGRTQSVNVYTPYPDILNTYRDVTVINASESGAGFKNVGDSGHTFTDLLSVYDPVIDHDLVTDVYALGGINDRVYNAATLELAMKEFCDKAHDVYPRAVVHIGFIGWSINPDAYSYIDLKNTLIVYRACQKFKAVYVSGIENVMHNMALFDADKLHPNQYGQIALAGALYNDIMGEPISTLYGRTTVDLFSRDGATFGRLLVESLENEKVGWGWDTTMAIGNLSIYGERAWDGSVTLSLANLGTDRGFALGENGMRQTVGCVVHTSTGSFIPAIAEVAVYHGLLQLTPYILSNGDWPDVVIDYVTIPPVWFDAITSEN